MAKISNVDGHKVQGKLNKKSKEVHRVIHGREFVHTIENPYDGPPTDAQKVQRSLFGKTNSIVNTIMADPEQAKLWEIKMMEYNNSIKPYRPPFPQRYKTVRKFAYDMISEQLAQTTTVKRRRAKLPIKLPRGVKMQIKTFADLSAAELYEILKARFNVFVMEQHIHYLDEDNIDYLATHFSLRRNGLVIAYARLFPDAEKGVLRIGRMLSFERGKGYAKYLIHKMIAIAAERGARTLRLHAQTPVVPFYEHLGFHTVGDIFVEAEIPHVTMEMNL